MAESMNLKEQQVVQVDDLEKRLKEQEKVLTRTLEARMARSLRRQEERVNKELQALAKEILAVQSQAVRGIVSNTVGGGVLGGVLGAASSTLLDGILQGGGVNVRNIATAGAGVLAQEVLNQSGLTFSSGQLISQLAGEMQLNRRNQ